MPKTKLPTFTEDFVNESTRKRLRHLFAPHLDSYDYFLENGLNEAVNDMLPFEMSISDSPDGKGSVENNLYIRMTVTNSQISYPMRKDETGGKLTPREARERGLTYAGGFLCGVNIQISNRQGQNLSEVNVTAKLGDIPIMVMSHKCHLRGVSPKSLVYDYKEEGNEMGGYFIMSGIERVIRLLQVPRRNYPMAIERNAFKNRGSQYSSYGVQMRCVRPDQSGVTLTVHYLNNGGATVRFVLRKQEFLLPVIIVAKALENVTDKELYDRIMQYNSGNTFISTRIELLLLDAKKYGLLTSEDCRAYLGAHFRIFLPITDRTSDVDAGILLLKRFFFVHTANMTQKLDCLIHCIRKLFSFAQGKCASDNADALMHHEILLPGHLMTMYVKEKIEEMLLAVRLNILKDIRASKDKVFSELSSNLSCAKYFQRLLDRNGGGIGGKVGTFLSTGNVVSSTGLDLMQVSGYTIIGEKLNMFRYMSHFQSVHRGQFFTTMKTTTVRKLLPESWGFLCPVHTPDGGPCGLLNHLAIDAMIVTHPTADKLPNTPYGPLAATASSLKTILDVYYPDSLDANKPVLSTTSSGVSFSVSPTGGKNSYWVCDTVELRRVFAGLGMVPASSGGQDGKTILMSEFYLPVMYDGIVMGGIHYTHAEAFVRQIRLLKMRDAISVSNSAESQKLVELSVRLDPTLEVAHIPYKPNGGSAFPGIYMFSAPGRMIRPVINLQPNGRHCLEYIGPLEQVFMDIACLSSEVVYPQLEGQDGSFTSHMEIHPTVMLSQIASFTPYSDYNQSPRNMYQCQMGKQTMGTPVHAFKHRGGDNKLYRIQNVQTPIVHTDTYREYKMDEYCQGVNAVVAVISYTGYDMEDAMIINRSSFERGFGHGSLYKNIIVDLAEEEKKALGGSGSASRPNYRFSNISKLPGTTDSDGVDDTLVYSKLDSDGLPNEGDIIEYGEPLCCFKDDSTGDHHTVKHKDSERVVIDSVRILGNNSNIVENMGKSSASGRPSLGGRVSFGGSNNTNQNACRRVSITLRYNRNPVIGDKFSSRHGQKGTLSVLWPQESMPFSESGISPDVIINPHAFPSRMTIGMLIESLAGKSGALMGKFQNATPFQFHEDNRVIDHLGKELRSAGYSYYGSEPLYNGISGCVMQADIFIGVVYYQRLRHMVSDKSQARSTGPVMAITRQPVKGRKKHGGIRLGEMERDALLSHGVAFCVHDRLMNCSDMHNAFVCDNCGGLITVFPVSTKADAVVNSASAKPQHGERQQSCSVCKSAASVKPVYLPYLTNELAGMGIRLTLKLSE